MECFEKLLEGITMTDITRLLVAISTLILALTAHSTKTMYEYHLKQMRAIERTRVANESCSGMANVWPFRDDDARWFTCLVNK